MVSLAERRRGAKHLQQTIGMSERRACRLAEIARSTQRRAPGRVEKTALISEIHKLSNRYPRFGYRKIFNRLKSAGWRVSRERVRLLRRTEGLRVPRKSPKRRRPGTSTIYLEQAEHPNHVWSYDFVADQTDDGKSVRFLTVIDEFTREALWIWQAQDSGPAVGLGIQSDHQAASLSASFRFLMNSDGVNPSSDPWGRSSLYS
jgi:hypothetical protein